MINTFMAAIHQDIYIPRFRNINGEKSKFLRGYGYQGSASRGNWTRNVAEYSIGAELMEAITEPGKWYLAWVLSAKCCHTTKIKLPSIKNT